ncbi:hypothetical protein BLNAU_11691 [Blattamonas nauphoetae]|uniref:Uncharacterized protein n=1 Tax=Blattamonas nauphoetae TaxID=2049346 RepID=A0ABQ9XPH1_9EUKA|nr:hypothetical protein BLNAU_11691 [Blattamonas nauphoetae]
MILFHLVPTRDNSCSGFAASLIPLLTSSNEKLVRSTLFLLDKVLSASVLSPRFEFLETGLFNLLPRTFYEHEMHLRPQLEVLLFPPPEMHLLNLTRSILMLPFHHRAGDIIQQRKFTLTTFHQIFVDKFFRPVEPFFEFVCKNRRRIEDSSDSRSFADVLGMISQFSPFVEQMTQFVLSSSLALACTDSLHFFETRTLVVALLQRVENGVNDWRNGSPDVQKRGHQIVDKLLEEGFSDEIGLHLETACSNHNRLRHAITGTPLVDLLGGNTLTKMRREEWWI